MTSLKHLCRVAAIVLVVGSTMLLPTSGASFSSTESNDDNSAATLVVAAPASASTSMTLNITPPATCEATVTWSASTTPGVTGYEVVRIDLDTSTVDAGPWTTAALTLVDDPVPMWLTGSGYEWRVRSILGNWRSAWSTAALTNPLLCVL